MTEIAWTTDDGERAQFFVEHTLLPVPWVLEYTDYTTRIAPARKVPVSTVCYALASAVARLARPNYAKVYLVGANPAFDDRFLRRAFAAVFGGRARVPYDYHLVDIASVAMGALGELVPRRLKDLRAAFGLAGVNPAPHTAEGDVDEVKLIWDTIRARGPH